MSEPAVILIVDDDQVTLRLFGQIVATDPSFRVLLASDGSHALALAREERPSLILSDYAMPGMDGRELCQLVKQDPTLSDCMFVMVTGVQDVHEKLDASENGIDDTLLKPVQAAELLGKVRSLLRLKQLHDQLRLDKLELETLHQKMEASFEQMLSLLGHIIEVSVHDAASRSTMLGDFAAQMAERFEIPTELRRDLDLAARLHEIGKVVIHPEAADADFLVADDSGNWRYVLATKELMERVEGLQAAGELVGYLFENWDGTGRPEHLQQGQIPLRSRILRVLIDFRAHLEVTHSSQEALERLEPHAGTWYDPLVIAYLKSIVAISPEDDWRDARVRVSVDNLAEGMVLADDLFTSGGVKLLAKGAEMSTTTLDVIRRRHRVDPILHGAWIAT